MNCVSWLFQWDKDDTGNQVTKKSKAFGGWNDTVRFLLPPFQKRVSLVACFASFQKSRTLQMMISNLPAVFYRLLNDEDHGVLVVFHQPEKRAENGRGLVPVHVDIGSFSCLKMFLFLNWLRRFISIYNFIHLLIFNFSIIPNLKRISQSCRRVFSLGPWDL